MLTTEKGTPFTAFGTRYIATLSSSPSTSKLRQPQFCYHPALGVADLQETGAMDVKNLVNYLPGQFAMNVNPGGWNAASASSTDTIRRQLTV